MSRIAAAINSLDHEAGTELDSVRREAFAGRPVFVEEAAAALRREASDLRPEVRAGRSPHGFPGEPRELFSNAAACDARRVALRVLADRLETRASEALFAEPADLARWLEEERKHLPAIEPAEAVQASILAARRDRPAGPEVVYEAPGGVVAGIGRIGARLFAARA
jgi:hypothetical protein